MQTNRGKIAQDSSTLLSFFRTAPYLVLPGVLLEILYEVVLQVLLPAVPRGGPTLEALEEQGDGDDVDSVGAVHRGQAGDYLRQYRTLLGQQIY